VINCMLLGFWCVVLRSSKVCLRRQGFVVIRACLCVLLISLGMTRLPCQLKFKAFSGLHGGTGTMCPVVV
jgi:hypothetical protein